jgi:cell division protein ZapA
VDNKGRAVVTIFGEDYRMRGEATSDYMIMLAGYVDKRMKQIAHRQPQLSVTKIAVLTALNVADELSKLQTDYDELVKLLDGEKKDELKNEIKEEKKFEKKPYRKYDKK